MQLNFKPRYPNYTIIKLIHEVLIDVWSSPPIYCERWISFKYLEATLSYSRSKYPNCTFTKVIREYHSLERDLTDKADKFIIAVILWKLSTKKKKEEQLQCKIVNKVIGQRKTRPPQVPTYI